MKGLLGTALATILALLAASCTFSLPGGSEKATLRLQLPSTSANARFLAAEAVHYKLKVESADGDVVVGEFDNGAIAITTGVGPATIYLDSYDAQGFLLTHGEAKALLLPGNNSVSLTLEPATTLEQSRPVLLSAGQLAYFQVKNQGSTVQSLMVYADYANLWKCASDASFDALSPASSIRVTLLPGERQIIRASQPSTSGLVQMWVEQSGNGQIQISPDIALQWAPSVVNRLDNQGLNLNFSVSLNIGIYEVYLDGVTYAVENSSPVWFSKAVSPVRTQEQVYVNVDNYWTGYNAGPHQITVVFEEAGSSQYWSYTHNYQIIDQPGWRLSTSNSRYAAIKPDGSLWIWDVGTQPTAASQVGTEYTWQSLSVGQGHTAAIKNDGSLWTWGDNSSGQLALGDTTPHAAPQPVNDSSMSAGAKAVVAGPDFTLMLNSSQQLYGSGVNDVYQLANTTAVSPVMLPYHNGWAVGAFQKIAAGQGFGVGIDQSRNLWVWGRGDRGQLGDSTVTLKNFPVSNWILDGHYFGDVAAGSDHVLAIEQSNLGNFLWSWGDNQFGQLGSGAIGLGDGYPYQNWGNSWQSVAAGDQISFALQWNNSLWYWGAVGTGATIVAGPTQLGYDYDWRRIVAAGDHLLAEKYNGTLWTWSVATQAFEQVNL
jgi:hypothetical protein